VPGRITSRTPAKAIAVAIRRSTVVRSPSISQASGRTKNGAIMVIDAALPSGM